MSLSRIRKGIDTPADRMKSKTVMVVNPENVTLVREQFLCGLDCDNCAIKFICFTTGAFAFELDETQYRDGTWEVVGVYVHHKT